MIRFLLAAFLSLSVPAEKALALEDDQVIEFDPSEDSEEPEQVPATPPEQEKAPDIQPKKDEKTDFDSVEKSIEEQATGVEKKTALLQGLNKVTARSSEVKAPIGKAVDFGNLQITAKKCVSSPSGEKPENAALLEIWDQMPGEEKKLAFSGWMFSSTPGLSTLEHPVYNITVISCL